MRKLLTSLSGVGYATGITTGVWQIDSLADGSLAFFENDGTLIDGAAPVITTTELFVALGRTTVGADKSVMIDRRSVAYNKYVYTAPISKQVVFGDDGTAVAGNELVFPTIVAGQEFGFVINDNTLPIEKTSRQHIYTHTTVSGDTAAIIMSDLISQIHGDFQCPVDCIATTVAHPEYGCYFVGNKGTYVGTIAAGADFAVSLYNDMNSVGHANIIEAYNAAAGAASTVIINGTQYDATTTPTLATFYGHTPVLLAQSGYKGEGTATDITAAELDYSTEQGNINAWYMINQLWTVPSRVVAGQTYTCYIIKWTAPNTQVDIGSLEKNPPQVLVLAVPSTDAVMIAAIDTILAAV